MEKLIQSSNYYTYENAYSGELADIHREVADGLFINRSEFRYIYHTSLGMLESIPLVGRIIAYVEVFSKHLFNGLFPYPPIDQAIENFQTIFELDPIRTFPTGLPNLIVEYASESYETADLETPEKVQNYYNTQLYWIAAYGLKNVTIRGDIDGICKTLYTLSTHRQASHLENPIDYSVSLEITHDYDEDLDRIDAINVLSDYFKSRDLPKIKQCIMKINSSPRGTMFIPELFEGFWEATTVDLSLNPRTNQFQAGLDRLHRIRHIEFIQDSDHPLEEGFIQTLKKAETLSMRRHFDTPLPDLPYFSQLRRLQLSGEYLDIHNFRNSLQNTVIELDLRLSQAEDTWLPLISAHCPHLELLDLSYTQVTKEGLSQFIKSSPRPPKIIGEEFED